MSPYDRFDKTEAPLFEQVKDDEERAARALEDDARRTIQERFEAFHQRQPGVYTELVRLARILKAKGRTHYSIDALMHVVRFNYVMHRDPQDEWKLNNDFSSRFARLIEAQEPDLQGFFEQRKLKAT